jgi:hypothetical protein
MATGVPMAKGRWLFERTRCRVGERHTSRPRTRHVTSVGATDPPINKTRRPQGCLGNRRTEAVSLSSAPRLCGRSV